MQIYSESSTRETQSVEPDTVSTAVSQTKRSLWKLLVRIVAWTLLLFMLNVGFSLLLSSSMLRSFSSENVLRAYSNAGTEVCKRIERGLRFGRPLAGYIGLHSQLEQTVTGLGGLHNLAVYDMSGNLVYSARPAAERLFSQAQGEKGTTTQPPQWNRTDSGWLRLDPIHGISGNQEGWLLSVVSTSATDGEYKRFFLLALPFLLLLALCCCAAQAGWTAFIHEARGNTEQQRRLLRRTLLFLIGGAQVVFAGGSLYFFSQSLDVSMRQAAEVSGSFLANDLEYLLEKQVVLENLPGLEEQLHALVHDSPGIDSAVLQVGSSSVATRQGDSSRSLAIPVFRYWSDRYTPKEQVATLRLHLDQPLLHKTIMRLALDLGTALLVSFLLLHQASSFLSGLFFTSASKETQATYADAGGAWAYGELAPKSVINMLIFLYFFAYDMVLSFIPLVSAIQKGSIDFIPHSVLPGLPISAEAVAAAFGLLSVGLLARLLSVRALFCFALLTSIAGALLSAISWHVGIFIFSRALSGFGFGMVLMTTQLATLNLTSNSASGLAGMYAALFAGSICGSAIGGMAYEFFGPENIFFAVAVMLIFPLWSLLLLGKHSLNMSHTPSLGLGRLLRSSRFLSPVVLVSIPSAMCLTGFLYLSVPIQLQEQGVQQADIGRLFMLYGLCFIFVGPLLASYADKLSSQRLCVVGTGISACLSLFCAAMFPGYWGYAFAVLFIGVSQCLLSSSMLIYILSLPLPTGVDPALTSSTYRLCERSGQVLGPLVFGLALSQAGHGLFVLGAGLFFMAVLFYMFSGGLVRQESRSN